MKEFLIWFTTFGICMFAHIRSIPETKERAIKEYLQHPENYTIQYVYPKGDTVCVDTIVTYLK